MVWIIDITHTYEFVWNIDHYITSVLQTLLEFVKFCGIRKSWCVSQTDVQP